MKSKFFVTTPIYYVNDAPHIGSACTTIAADIIARYHRLSGDEVFFLTGTDEHGAKIAQAAEKLRLSPQILCDQTAAKFEKAWKDLAIEYDYFIRTTHLEHVKEVCKLISKVYEKGDIYKKNYEGWYCVGCEAFKSDEELTDGHCPEHKPEQTVWQKEENYFFKLSKYVPQIIRLLEDEKTNYSFPLGRRAEILAKLKSGVDDISISRANVKWGIPIPWDPTQTIYVWFDALPNYYSATRFLEGKSDFWPADLHLVGKGINWFHTVFWQGMLLSAELPLPKKIFAHSHFNVDGAKMSKSLGNVITPSQLLNVFGVDATRYLIASSMPVFDDADIGITRFKEKFNADLANNLGNLVSRLSKLGEGLDIESSNLKQFDPEFRTLIDRVELPQAISWVFEQIINPINVKLNLDKPWTLDSASEERKNILRQAISQVLRGAWHLRPVMPQTSEEIWARLGLGKVVYKKEGLFPRLA